MQNREIEWIAHRGGKALLNPHPAFVGFGASNFNPNESLPRFYFEFLKYIQAKWSYRFLQPLPTELAGLNYERA